MVERNADWSQWTLISRAFDHVLMLVQQSDEPSEEFHARVLERMAQVDEKLLDQVVFLRDRSKLDGIHAEPLSAPLLEQIGASARGGLRVYPLPATA
ncbi:MAG: hypothetical protein ABW321_01365 [Polyangiales bacterium]